ncbi:hypothetical protein HPP92_017776 [Vanilla planifolia]|uniref:Uncharacterized protein n=1 Tax=Vanilla planifolia TaxID=51239 RepID=A0A835QBQ7_VANPL|nr:hypothetical protein HPP92_017776 [Vanilla planifolia]
MGKTNDLFGNLKLINFFSNYKDSFNKLERSETNKPKEDAVKVGCLIQSLDTAPSRPKKEKPSRLDA